MTQNRTRIFLFTLTAMLGFLMLAPQLASAQEAPRIPANSRAERERASDAAYNKDQPEKAVPGAKRDSAHVVEEPHADDEITPADSEVAIDSAAFDAITTFDPAKVRGIARPWQIYYQEPASPVQAHLEGLHDGIMVVITLITLLVLGLLIYVCVRFRAKRNPNPQRFAHNTVIEVLWTLVPILILIGIGIPSVRAHFQYTNNENIISNPDMTLKVTGHQWYWSYEYPEHGIAFDSNIVPEDQLNEGEPRLLMVDNPVVVPVGKVVRVQTTSADVIHNFAMPAMGLKQDVVPGRLNETWFKATQEGIYFGQCSELCGKYHGFMPIMFYVVSEEEFDLWVRGAKEKFATGEHLQLASLHQ